MPLYSLMGPQSAQGGLLGAAQAYPFPMTSGLLNAISSAGGVGPFTSRAVGPGAYNAAVAAQQAAMSAPPQNYSQLALQLAGDPHAGPYAGNLGTVGAGTPTATAGSTSGGSTASQIAGGLLGAIEKNPSALQGLLGGNSLSALGSQAAADTASELGSAAAPALAADTSAALAAPAGLDAAIQAGVGTDALTTPIVAAPAASAAPVAAAPASGGLLSTLGAIAPVAGIVGAALMAPTVTGLGQAVNKEGKTVAQATQAGLLSPSDTTAGSSDAFLPNGAINQPLMNGLNALQELQATTGVAAPQAQGLLNALGYKTYAQQVAANGGWKPTPQGGGSNGPRGLIQSF